MQCPPDVAVHWASDAQHVGPPASGQTTVAGGVRGVQWWKPSLPRAHSNSEQGGEEQMPVGQLASDWHSSRPPVPAAPPPVPLTPLAPLPPPVPLTPLAPLPPLAPPAPLPPLDPAVPVPAP